MLTFGFPSAARHIAEDLDGAFNDGYQLSAQSRGAVVRRCAVIAWSIAAWCIGTLVMGAALFDGACRLWRSLR